MTRQVVAARTGKKNVSAHSTCTTGSDLCGMGHELMQAWPRFFVKDYSIRIQRLVPADDDEPGVSALGIAAEDGHVLADRLVGAARQPAVVKQADLRIGRVEQYANPPVSQRRVDALLPPTYPPTHDHPRRRFQERRPLVRRRPQGQAAGCGLNNPSQKTGAMLASIRDPSRTGQTRSCTWSVR